MSIRLAILTTTLILSSCNLQSSPSTASFSQVATEVSMAQNSEAEFLISDSGIGQAKLGMTLGELKQLSPPDTKFESVSPFTIESNAISVSRDGLVQYYILYSTTHDNNKGSEEDKFLPQDEDLITWLVTDNQDYQTKEGIKVGTPIEEAEKIYGNAILAYNQEDGAGEYITFSNKSASNIRFRASYFKLISEGLGYSGIYPEYPGTSYTTNKYQNDAAIAAIEVSCEEETCLN